MFVEDITNIIWTSTFREDFESSTMAAILWPNPYEEFLWRTSHILFIPTKKSFGLVVSRDFLNFNQTEAKINHGTNVFCLKR